MKMKMKMKMNMKMNMNMNMMSTPMLAILTWVAWRMRVGPCSPLPAHLVNERAVSMAYIGPQ